MNFLNRVMSASGRLAMVGVPLALAGAVGLYVHWLPKPRLAAHHVSTMHVRSEAHVKLRGPGLATISVEGPSEMHIGGSADVQANATLTGPQLDNKRHTVMFLLSGAGLEVQPADWLEVQAVPAGKPPSTALWSVSAKDPGDYHLVLNTKQPSDPQASIAPLPLDLTFNKSQNLALHVERRWTDYVAVYWPHVTAFMGSLLTLPGLIAFFRKTKSQDQDTDINGE